jgi:hypothetical protein
MVVASATKPVEFVGEAQGREVLKLVKVVFQVL